ncbi:MAG: hypothetical protein ABFS41_16905 [Myxococcota bacterium]
MTRTLLLFTVLLLTGGVAAAQPAAPAGDKVLPGMSVVGNDDAPKALVIVPWKSSVMGDTLDVSRTPDDGRQPVDRDVFRRELDYYRIRVDATEPAS